MKIIVPIYIRQNRSGSASHRGASVVTVSPLLRRQPEVTGDDLGRALAKMTNVLRKNLTALASGDRHDELWRWHHPEEIGSHWVKTRLDLKDRTVDLRLLVATMSDRDRRFAFSPSLPELWFDIERTESVQQRTADVFRDLLNQQIKSNPGVTIDTLLMDGRLALDGRAWVDHLAVDVLAATSAKSKVDPLRALLGGESITDGAAELRKVGRCLNWLDADELSKPIAIKPDVDRLCQWLDAGDRPGVVLVGPSGSGKTARIEGVVRRRMRRARAATHGLVWHLSPPRLISGMSYLGQWQQRVLAILRHAHRYDHVLYFDDLLGLFEAGKTRDSSMCVADVLRTQLIDRPVRIVAEMTDQAWSILRERDRALADRFMVMPTEAMDVPRTYKIMIGAQRQLEARHDCRFDIDVIPEITSIYGRFDQSGVLPGKAVAAMSRLAARGKGRGISREDAITEFESRSGLRASIIDQTQIIQRRHLQNRIGQSVIGQDVAIDRLIDRIVLAASRLNDTSRPLGTFLLVGPTGVGKTQLAKAVADCMFDDGGLIRLDMNELSSPGSAARLVGTFDAPDGLLTAAVRRRPHAVLLLDEIEKAHPSVLDVLLQALGEARLTDARGRTVDLSGLLILMTSNLGARQSGRSSGFDGGQDNASIADVHVRAAKEFFRPEFFNRIDGVLSFDRLTMDQLRQIARLQFREVLQRDGLSRRGVLIDVDPEAIEETARRGFDPRMGARSLKRQIERDLIRPAAEALASTSQDQTMLLRLTLDKTADAKTARIVSACETIVFEQPEHDDMDLGTLLAAASDYLDGVAREFDGEPIRISVGSDGIDPRAVSAMMIRDGFQDCCERLRVIDDERGRIRLDRAQATPVKSANYGIDRQSAGGRSRRRLLALHSIDDIEDFLKESLQVITPHEFDTARDGLIDQMTRLDEMRRERNSASRFLLWTRWFGADACQNNRPGGRVTRLSGCGMSFLLAMSDWLTDGEGLAVDPLPSSDDVFVCSGSLSMASLCELVGGWLFIERSHGTTLIDVRVRSIVDDVPIQTQWERWYADQHNAPVAPVRRVLKTTGPQTDLRTGQSVHEAMSKDSIDKLLNLSRRRLNFATPTQHDPNQSRTIAPIVPDQS